MDDHAAAEQPGPRPSAPPTTVEVGAARSGSDEACGGRVILRTVYGGPTPQDGVIEEVARIRRVLRDVPFSYDLDLVLMIGGDVTPGSGPSGLRSPRVSLARRTATAQVHVTRDDALHAPDPVAFLRTTVHEALVQLVARVATRDPEVDSDAYAERARLAPLVADDPSTAPQV